MQIHEVQSSNQCPPTREECHDAVKKAFKWEEVANATVEVYKKVQGVEKTTIRQLFKKYHLNHPYSDRIKFQLNCFIVVT